MVVLGPVIILPYINFIYLITNKDLIITCLTIWQLDRKLSQSLEEEERCVTDYYYEIFF